ncbi:uncharacterized protein E0L32_000221 [Thyridium curvatum]|uniref:Oxidoreductase n=1 Tax=Thyridium curvatum TaxID=1093900 RepID=A0A507B7V7_9PEZI|nr:uncharacterized protein E0L32_000221 [Thyridium curvatum]TPX15887.1 hypothetical protein E0L32_000221 [Thyridium curvatum]
MVSSSPVTIAIIGFSGGIGKRHTSVALANPEVKLVALVDPSPAAGPIAESHSVPYFRSVRELLSSTTVAKPMGAIVCTPNHTHVPVAKELATAGIHLLIEKPVSISGAEGQELLQCLKENGVRALVGHQRRFNEHVVAAKRVIDEGRLGDVTAVSALWTLYKSLAYFNGGPNISWRSSRKNGGGVVLMNLIHEIDMLQYFLGPITRVHAEKTISRRTTVDVGVEEDDRAEEGAALTLRFKSGVVGTFLVSDCVVSPHNYEVSVGDNPHTLSNLKDEKIDVYRIFGTDASLSVPDMVLWSHVPGAGKGRQVPLQKETIPVGNDLRDSFTRQLEHFVHVIRGEAESNCPPEEGLRAALVCETIIRALDSPSGTLDVPDIS